MKALVPSVGRALCALLWLLAIGCTPERLPIDEVPPGATDRLDPAPQPGMEPLSLARLLGSVRHDLLGIQASAATRIERRSDGFVPEWDPSARVTARIRIPLSAAAPMGIAHATRPMAIAVTLEGARDTVPVLSDGLVIHRDALGTGAHLIHRPRTDGVEDFVLFERRPEVEHIEYSVDMSSVFGLRLVANILELLDRDGTPRIRVKAPWLLDAAGRVFQPQLQTEAAGDPSTCIPDTSPVVPWGRPVQPPCPGRAPGSMCVCKLRLGWGHAPMTYPILIDPSWEETSPMVQPRFDHAGIELSTGRVLVSGGTHDLYEHFKSAEVYDHDTNTWTATGDMLVGRKRHTATRLADGTVLVAGGILNNVPLAHAEIYNHETGLWSEVAPMAGPRWMHTATLLPDNSVLVAGGSDQEFADLATAETERFFPQGDGVAAHWEPAGTMAYPRRSHTATLVTFPKDFVLIAGGRFSDGRHQYIINAVERYHLPAGTWTPGPHMKTPRCYHTATALPDGAVLVAGGRNGGSSDILNETELFSIDGSGGSSTLGWKDGPTMLWRRNQHTAAFLGDRVVVAGGYDQSVLPLATAEVLLHGSTGWLDSTSWLDAGPMLYPHHDATAHVVEDTLVVVGNSPVAERFRVLGPSEPCVAGGECESTLCAEGVCCDTPCQGTCEACSFEEKGYGKDGVCEDKAGSPCGLYACVDGECKQSCTENGDCATGYLCLEGGDCVSPVSQCGEAEGTVMTPGEPQRWCNGYQCKDGDCLPECFSGAECVLGFRCHDDHRCHGEEADPADAGCSCRLQSARDRGGSVPPWTLAGGLGVAAALWRRRLKTGSPTLFPDAARRRVDEWLARGAALLLALAAGCADPEGELAGTPVKWRPSAEGSRQPAPGAAQIRLDESGALVTDLGSAAQSGLRLRLPPRATGTAELEHVTSGMRVTWRLQGSLDVGLRVTPREIVFPSGAPSGGDIAYELRNNGVKDVIQFERRPTEEAVQYDLGVTGVAGLRLVADTIELLDPGGVPRLRMAPPWVVDATGTYRRAAVSLEDCAHDRSPLPPWGRQVVPPCSGSSAGRSCSCRLTIDWRGKGVDYPALLDPVWEETGDLAVARALSAAIVMENDHVLVAGGQGMSNGPLDAVEEFDPVSGTWTVRKPLTQPRERPSINLLPGGGLLVAGGRASEELKSAESLDPHTGDWQWTTMLHRHLYHAALTLPDGRVVVTGGNPHPKSAEIFYPDTGIWKPLPEMLYEHLHHGIVLDGESPFVVGGNWTPQETTERLDLARAAWIEGPPMKHRRREHVIGALPDGTIFAVGGSGGPVGGECCSPLSSIELLGPTSDAWELAPSMFWGREQHAAVVLGNGFVLVSGGRRGGASIDGSDSAEVFDPRTRTWTMTSMLNVPRVDHASVPLKGVAALIVGGTTGPVLNEVSTSTEIWRADELGAPCEHGATCASGFCADGVCCDSACDADCLACQAKHKSKGPEGTCGPRAELPCGVYLCDDEQNCRTQCTEDHDCTEGHGCSEAGECLLLDPICDGEHTLEGLNGEDCSPYKCVPNTCLKLCSSNAHCVADHRCVDSRCSPLEPPATSLSGCACSAAGRSAEVEGTTALLAVAAIASGLLRYARRSVAS